MTTENGYCIVLCTCPDDSHADDIAVKLVEKKLAACVQILPIRSCYEWQGEICRDTERLLFIKTKTAMYGDIEEFIILNHPYEVPEIVRLDITGGLDKYLAWVNSVIG